MLLLSFRQNLDIANTAKGGSNGTIDVPDTHKSVDNTYDAILAGSNFLNNVAMPLRALFQTRRHNDR